MISAERSRDHDGEKKICAECMSKLTYGTELLEPARVT